MSVTVELPDDALRKLQAEAERRGVSIDVIIAELAAALPGEQTSPAGDTLERFFGCGDSGDTSWATRDVHELRHELTERRLAEPA